MSRLLEGTKCEAVTSKLAAMLAAAWLMLVCAGVKAADCEERCFDAFMACASSKASGCTVNSRPVGPPEVRLAKASGLDEALADLESVTKISSEEECEALLGLCDEIELSCHINCVPGDEPVSALAPAAHPDVEMDFTEAKEQPTQPRATVPKIREGIKSGTLRIFSDHPQVRLFLNEWEVPVKPEGRDVESLVTPKLAVGYYWVRLISVDGEWQWEGNAIISAAKVNEIRPDLVNLVEVRASLEEAMKKHSKKIWREMKKLENAENLNTAISAYESFMEVYPKKKAICKRAEKKKEKLEKRYEKMLFDEILDSVRIDEVQRLCSLYLSDYPEGEYTKSVSRIVNEIVALRIQAYKDAKMKRWFTAGCGESPTGTGGWMCYVPGGSFTMGYDE